MTVLNQRVVLQNGFEGAPVPAGVEVGTSAHYLAVPHGQGAQREMRCDRPRLGIAELGPGEVARTYRAGDDGRWHFVHEEERI